MALSASYNDNQLLDNARLVALAYFTSVQDPGYGAAGDGVTDDTAAIQAAIDAAAPGGIFFPPGDYLITSQVTLPSDVWLVGAGEDTAVILAEFAGAAFGTGQTAYDTDTAERRFRIRIEGLGFQGDSSGAIAGSIGVDLSQCSHGRVRQCRVRFFETGVRISNVAYYNKVQDSECSNATHGVLIENGANSNAIDDVRSVAVVNGATLREGSDGAANNITIKDLRVETFTGRGIWMNGASAGLLASNGVRGCRFEGGPTGIELEAGALNCYIAPDQHFASLTDLVIDNGVRTQWEATGGFRTQIMHFDGSTPGAFYYDSGTDAWLTRNEADTAWVNLRTGEITIDGGSTVGSGTGSPEGVRVAGRGSTWHRTDGGAGTCFYVKETASGNTGWVAK